MAGMNVSALGIEVKSKGIDDATKSLKDLAIAAKSVDSETKQFLVSQAKLPAITNSSTSATEKYLAKLDKQANTMGKNAEETARYMSVVKQLDAAQTATAAALGKQVDIYKAQASAQKESERAAIALEKATKKNEESLRSAHSSGSIWNNTLKSMAVAATAYLGVNFAKGIIEQSDAWVMMQAKLKLTTGSMEAAKVIQQDLFVLAQKIRVPLEDAAKLYTRMALPMQMMGKSAKDTMGMVEGMGLALQLGGSTAAEASSVMLQFSQSMNAGRLNGAEFNAVAEGAPIILRAIETELRRTGQWGENTTETLKKMGSQGLITGELLANAMKNALPQMRKDFESLPITVDSAMTMVKNAWFKAIGELGQDSELGSKLSKAVMDLVDYMPTLAKAVGGTLVFIIDHLKSIGVIISGLVTFGLAGWAAGAALSLIQLAKAVGLVEVAMSLLGKTPIGLAISAAAFAVGASIAVWNLYGFGINEVKKSTEELSKSIPDMVKEVNAETEAYQKQIDKIRGVIQEKDKLNLKEGGANEGRLADINARIIALAKQESARQTIGGTAAMQVLISQKAEIDNSIRLSELKKQELDLAVKNSNQAKYTSEINAKYDLNKAGQMKAEIEALDKTRLSAEKYAEAVTAIKKSYADKNTQKHFTVQLESLNKANVMMQEQLELQKQLAAEGAGAKLSPMEKSIEKHREENEVISKNLALGKEKNVAGAKARLADNEAAISKLVLVNALFNENEATKEAATAYASRLKTSQEAVKSAQAEAENLQRLVDTFGMAKGAVEAKELADLQAIETSKKGTARTLDEIQAAYDLIEAKKQAAGLTTELGGLEEAKKAQDILDKAFNPSKVDKWANSIKGAFKGAAAALQPFAKAIDTYGAKQAHIDDLREAANKKYSKGSKELAEYTEKISNKETEYRIASYGDMASAAKGFFEEGSNGYKTMEGIAQTAHAAQVAMNLIEMGQMAVKAVLNQANGDPYTAFARMAAMAAAVATLGFAVGGGFKSSSGGGAKAADAQKTQGTGTVFGDSSAKSASIENSLKMMEQYADTGLSHTSDMMKSLRSIDKSMSGLANLIVKTTGLTEGTGFGIKEGQINAKGSATDAISGAMTHVTKALFGPLLGSKISSAINNLWGKVTQNITDAGLKVQGTLGQLQAGQGVNQYANVDTTKSSWFGLSKSTSSSVQTQGVGAELSTQFGKIFTSLEATLKVAAQGLGVSAAQVDDALKNLVIDASISLKGLSGDALAQAINSVISKAADTMASSVMSGLLEFAKVGEGAFETLVRISSEMIVTNETMTQLGHSLFTLDVAGIKASQSLIDLYGGIDKLQEVSSSYYDNFYTEGEKSAKAVTAMTEALARLGIEMPTDRADFRAEVEKANREGNYELYVSLMKLSEAYAEIVPATEASLSAADLVSKRKEMDIQEYELQHTSLENLAASRERELATTDATLQAQMNRIYALQDEASALEKANAIASQRRGLEIQIMELTGDKAGALNARRADELAAMDESLRPFQLRIYALQDQAEAESAAASASKAAGDAAKQAADTARSAWQSVTDSLFAEVKRIKGLLTGNTAQSYAGLQATFATTSAQARAGDIEAAKQLPAISQALLAMADSQASSMEELNRIRAQVMGSLVTTGSSLSAAQGTNIPAFADGGFHSGGMALVGEVGAELIDSSPAHVYNAAQTKELLNGNSMREVVQELKDLRSEARAQANAVVDKLTKTYKIVDNWNVNGLIVKGDTANTPVQVQVV